MEAMTPNRNNLVAAAGETIRRGSRSFHMASHLFDRTTRERAWLLYAWCRHCDDVADGQVLGHGMTGEAAAPVAHLRHETERALRGEGRGEGPFAGVALVAEECRIPHRLLFDHLRGFEMDAEAWRPQSEEDLVRYCYHVAGVVGCMMAVVMGVQPEDEETLARAADLGIAFQLSNIARDLREDHQAGRCYLPAEWMREEGIDTVDPFRVDQAPALVALSGRLVRLAERYELASARGVPKLPFRARWAVLAATRIYGAIGRRVAALGPTAWDARVVVRRREKLAFLIPSLIASARQRQDA